MAYTRPLLPHSQETLSLRSPASFSTLSSSSLSAFSLFYRQKPADLIITDIVMPTKEGIEMIAELRQEFPDINIIAISGGGLGLAEDYLDWAQHLGAQLTFAKPVDLDELSEAVHNLIDKEKIYTRCLSKQRS